MMERGRVAQPDISGTTTNSSQQRRWQVWIPVIAGALLLVLIIYSGACAFLVDRDGPVHLVVYAFSTQEEVLTQSILPSFDAAWEAESGRELIIDGVFGPLSTLAGQITLGAPADVAILSNAHHVTYLRLDRRIREETQPQVLGETPTQRLADNVLFMWLGALVEQGPAHALFAAPQHELTAAYLAGHIG